jgi:acetyl esterase/lipase
VDLDRVAVMGDSAGGHLAALLALAPASLGACGEGDVRVKAVVSL